MRATEKKQIVRDLVRAKVETNAPEIMRITQMPHSTVLRLLNQMEAAGEVIRKGQGSGNLVTWRWAKTPAVETKSKWQTELPPLASNPIFQWGISNHARTGS